jgi:hypothetical protein
MLPFAARLWVKSQARSTTRLLGLLGALGLLLAVGLANDLLTVKLGAPSLVAPCRRALRSAG